MKSCKTCKFSAVCLGTDFSDVFLQLLRLVPDEANTPVAEDAVDQRACAVIKEVQAFLPRGCAEFKPGMTIGLWIPIEGYSRKLTRVVIQEPP